MKKLIPQFTTNRLIIRKIGLHDVKSLFRNYTQDPEVTKYLTWKPHKSIEETRKFVLGCMQENKSNYPEFTRYAFVIALKDNPSEVIGMVDVSTQKHIAGIGYCIAKKFWGKGYMAEAVKPIMDFLFSFPQIYRIQASYDIENLQSAKVMQKLGMEFEGIYRRCTIHPNISETIPRDCGMYSIVK